MTGRALTARMGLVLCVFAWTLPARAQENFEIQVYGSETVAPGDTMVELHSNVAAEGSRRTVNGVLRTQGAFHETLEITQGITSWLETGFYVFTSIQPDTTWEWVGDHIRPRVRAPESWELPVGLSLSAELGYQRRAFSTDTWTLELRPIVDRQWNRWYVSINPTLDRAIKGESVDRGFEFSPAAKVSYNVAPKVAIGLEYYGALGPVTHFDRAHDQQHQLFPVIDLDLGPRWEFNAGGRLRTHPEHRPVHCQDDPWLPLQLGRRGAQVALVSSPFGAGGMARKSLS
ncbi:MAG TPA: hypothetical protein VJX92_10480, partial [Methylomirabilota bacterium]|nr:hypothetical protein [Methylomirabilota bacterium]